MMQGVVAVQLAAARREFCRHAVCDMCAAELPERMIGWQKMACCVRLFFVSRACMGSKAHVYVLLTRVRCRTCAFFVRAAVL